MAASVNESGAASSARRPARPSAASTSAPALRCRAELAAAAAMAQHAGQARRLGRVAGEAQHHGRTPP